MSRILVHTVDIGAAVFATRDQTNKALVRMAPGRWWRSNGARDVELHAKATVGAFSTQRVREKPVRHDLDGPDIVRRRGDEFGGMRVGVELLSRRFAGCSCIAAVLRDGVFAAIGMTVIVLQPHAMIGPSENPGP